MTYQQGDVPMARLRKRLPANEAMVTARRSQAAKVIDAETAQSDLETLFDQNWLPFVGGVDVSPTGAVGASPEPATRMPPENWQGRPCGASMA